MNANVFKKNANDPQAAKQDQKSSPSPLRTQATVVHSRKPGEQNGAVEGDHRLDNQETRTRWARSTRMGFRKTRKPSRKIPSARERTNPSMKHN